MVGGDRRSGSGRDRKGNKSVAVVEAPSEEEDQAWMAQFDRSQKAPMDLSGLLPKDFGLSEGGSSSSKSKGTTSSSSKGGEDSSSSGGVTSVVVEEEDDKGEETTVVIGGVAEAAAVVAAPQQSAWKDIASKNTGSNNNWE